MYYTPIAICEYIHRCDCCGRKNLKSTVLCQDDAGDMFNFGSTCATKHTGCDVANIRLETLTKVNHDKERNLPMGLVRRLDCGVGFD